MDRPEGAVLAEPLPNARLEPAPESPDPPFAEADDPPDSRSMTVSLYISRKEALIWYFHPYSRIN